MIQDKPKTGHAQGRFTEANIGLTFLFGMLILLTASFGIALARRNGVIKEENKAFTEKVIQLEEKVRILTHSKEELETVRSNLAAEIEQMKLIIEQQSKETEGIGNRE